MTNLQNFLIANMNGQNFTQWGLNASQASNVVSYCNQVCALTHIGVSPNYLQIGGGYAVPYMIEQYGPSGGLLLTKR